MFFENQAPHQPGDDTQNVVRVDFIAARKAREASIRGFFTSFVHFPTRYPWAYRMVLAACILILSLCVL